MPRRGYHHGNLKQALVDATLQLIQVKGPAGFTLAEAAKTAEVTPAAVYRHFEGRDELIAECARQGHEIFRDLLAFAYNDGRPSVLAAFEATGRAYLAFARKHPGHYIAMFESGLSSHASPGLQKAAANSRAVLERAADALAQQIPIDRRPPASMFSAHIWALSHGVVELFARGTPGANSPLDPEQLLETGVGIYLRGLGLIEKDQ